MQVRRVRRQTRTHIAQLGTYLVHFTHIRNRGRIGHHLMDARTDFRPVRGSAIQTDPRFTQPQGTQTLFSHRRTRRRTPQVDHAPAIGRTISKNRAHQRSVIRTVRHIHNERTTRSNSFNNILLLRRQIACATFFPRIAIGWNRIGQYAMSVLASFLIAGQSTHNIRAQNMLRIVVLAVQLRSRMLEQPDDEFVTKLKLVKMTTQLADLRQRLGRREPVDRCRFINQRLSIDCDSALQQS